MTTPVVPTHPEGGAAVPVHAVSGPSIGGAAIPVYVVSDGRPTLGQPPRRVKVITDADLTINGGNYWIEGRPAAMPVVSVTSGGDEGGIAIPVYVVSGSLSGGGGGGGGGGTAPQYSSGEIGTVNAFTIPVTFDANVSASNYSTGVTIKVNGTATSITSATRQANHAVVRYVIPVLWHGSGDTVTWEYNAAVGNIVSESDATPLGNVAAQTVTNNCEYAALLDLQADTVSGDTTPFSGSGTITQSGTTVTGVAVVFGGEVVAGDHIVSAGGAIDGIVQSITSGSILELDTSATVAVGVAYTVTPQSASGRVTTGSHAWLDQSGQAHHFTQSGSITLCPIHLNIGGYRAVFLDGFWDYRNLLGSDFADNLVSFMLMSLARTSSVGADLPILCKVNNSNSDIGWWASLGGSHIVLQQSPGVSYSQVDNALVADEVFHVKTLLVTSWAVLHAYTDGVLDESAVYGETPITSISNAEPLRIGIDGNTDLTPDGYIRGELLFYPIPNATNRAALETRLGARYGLTVP